MKRAVIERGMTADVFLAWSRSRPGEERYELVDGDVVAMAGDSIRHNLTKGELFAALRAGVAAAALPCRVFVDGVNVRVNDRTVRIPDGVVQCSPVTDLDSTLVEPVIVAEVVSPSSERDDSGEKLADYMAVGSIEHYLIVRPEQGVFIHHRREASAWRTALVRTGVLKLDPPGFAFDIEPVLRAGLG